MRSNGNFISHELYVGGIEAVVSSKNLFCSSCQALQVLHIFAALKDLSVRTSSSKMFGSFAGHSVNVCKVSAERLVFRAEFDEHSS